MFAAASPLRTSPAASSAVGEPEPKQRRLSFSHASSSSVESTPSLVHTPTDDPQNEFMKIALNSLQYPVERAAQHVREDEESPLGEKSRQVFGMSWLLRNCEKQRDSNVPRNQIYAAYVATCTELNLRPLNHASFGKLVRTCFPDIRTRRLGVRGKSKYHYCGIMLLAPPPEPRSSNAMPQVAQKNHPHASQPAPSSDPLAATVMAQPNNQMGLIPTMQLPELADFVGDEDPVAIATLQNLYTTHCRQLADLLRTFNVKKYINLVAGFFPSLAVPIQRLLLTTGAVTWVRECDGVLYRDFVYLCGQRSLTPMTPPIAEALSLLACQLPSTLQSCKKVPGDALASQALERVKVEEAQKFAEMIDRLLRLNESAQAAMRVFTSEEVVAMKHEWEMAITPAASRDTPCCRELSAQFLGQDVPSLLSLRNEKPLEHWARWITGIKDRFPSIGPRIFALHAGAVSTAALRDLNRAGCTTFGAWWVVRCWLDDWMAWTAEYSDYLNLCRGGNSSNHSLES